MNLSEHFQSGEFACKCGCGFDSVDMALVAALEDLRRVVGRPVRVNSGCRCAGQNHRTGGAEGSQHLLGRAADILIQDVPPVAVGWIAKTLGCFSGIKIYGSWTHLDVREGPRWESGF